VSLAGWARQAREAWEVPRDLLLRRYPAFVTGGPLRRGEVPVFVFHSLEPVSFERKLRHLADNGYAALSADEYMDLLSERRPCREKAVLLTFDDGRGSLWTIGAPLLRRYGMRGVVFLVPGRMESRPGPLSPTWNDVATGQADAGQILAREAGPRALLSWEEVDALSHDGVFEFQSHTHRHARIHVAPRLAGFLAPGFRHGYAAMDVPLLASGGRDLLPHEAPLGSPLLVSAPRTSEALRFHEDEAFRSRCVDAVAQAGGEAFFSRPGWERELRRLAAATAVRGRTETAAEREDAIRAELVRSKLAIEERTGRQVRHLCYPWHAWGPTARRLAAEAGYAAAYCGKLPGVPLTRPGGDPLAIVRIGEDYLELLPGGGRSSLTEVLRRKWTRRLGGAA